MSQIWFISFNGGKRYVTSAENEKQARSNAASQWWYINGRDSEVPPMEVWAQRYKGELLVAVDE
jgi:hypothetical protein